MLARELLFVEVWEQEDETRSSRTKHTRIADGEKDVYFWSTIHR